MSTARGLVTNALKTAGVIAPIETPNQEEIVHGLNELNLLLDTLSNEHQWPYTNTRLETVLVSGKKKMSIGVGDGLKIESITGASTTTWTVTTTRDHGYSVGTIVKILDTEYHNIVALPITSVTPSTFTATGAPIVATDEGLGGYVYKTTDTIPDIRTPRPFDITTILVNYPVYWSELKQYTPSEWDTFANNTIVTGYPGIFVYHSDFPFGEIEFDTIMGDAYSADIHYRVPITEYELNDDINLPPGYESYLQYGLAEILADVYGVNNPKLAVTASKRLASLKRQNYKPDILTPDHSGSGQYNVWTDQWGN